MERLSLGGRIYSPLCSNMSSEHFEMLLFLHLAKWVSFFQILLCFNKILLLLSNIVQVVITSKCLEKVLPGSIGIANTNEF